ncbi:38565_t:CDS:2, partial [Gigaspora margarita]
EKKNRSIVRDMMLHHDNATPHTTGIVTDYLKKERVKILPHPSYSPDLVPCDFFLFPRIKKELAEKVLMSVQAIVDSIPKEEYQKSFQSWKYQLRKCIKVDG